MSRHPPQPPHAPLDAEERALAALLPRPNGHGEPSSELDARILASAAAALQPQLAKRRPRRIWIAPISVAASLVLAVGLAWQLRPPPVPAAHESTTAAASAESDATAVFAIEMPPAAPETQKPSMPTPKVPASAMPATTAPVAESGKRAAADAIIEIADVAAVPAPPQPAPPPPAPPAAVVASEAGTVQQMAEPARAMAKARASEAARERSEVSANAATQAADAAQRAAADATTLDTVTLADDPGEEVPPATADSPEVRDAWLRRIGELLKQGKSEEAKASLAEFKRRYPQATLPPELRKLEP